MSKSGDDEFSDFPVLPPRYSLCANKSIKFTFGVGAVLQLAAVGLIIAMLAVGPWMHLEVTDGIDINNKFQIPRDIGAVHDCFYNTSLQPSGYKPEMLTSCYVKDFGQYTGTGTKQAQKYLAVAEVSLLGLGLVTSDIALTMAFYLLTLWCRAPFDSLFVRRFRFFTALTSMVSSLLILAGIVVFHLDLFMEVISMNRAARIATVLTPSYGYAIAWAAEGASLAAACILFTTTCCWAVDYVNCGSIAAAFNPSCSQRQNVSQPLGASGVQNSGYSTNSLGKWSIHDIPTLPRFHTNTYGDGSELRQMQPVVST